MPQQMKKKPQKRKSKKKAKVEFDAGMVFDVEPATDLKLDIEASRFKARKGQGGTRRGGPGGSPTPRVGLGGFATV